jgi:NAD(P)H-dependent flavin oxidoreductase YrpB (nitropropane dioxygenase family)
MKAFRKLAGAAAQEMAPKTRMQRWFPSTLYPLVISAPMDFVTNSKLATEVTKTGGFG